MAAMTEEIEQVAQRYIRYTAIGAVMIAMAWHTGYDLTMTITGWPVFRWPELAAVAWLLHTAIAVIAALGADSRTPAARPGTRARRPALAVDIAVILACYPEDLLGPINWGWGSVGWLGVVLLWNRPRWRAEADRVPVRERGHHAGGDGRDRDARPRLRRQVSGGQAGSATLQLGYMAGCHTLRVRVPRTRCCWPAGSPPTTPGARRPGPSTPTGCAAYARHPRGRGVAAGAARRRRRSRRSRRPRGLHGRGHAAAPPHHRAGGRARRAGLGAARAHRRGRAAPGPGDGAAVRREPARPAGGRTAKICSERRSRRWTAPGRGPGSLCPRCPPW